MNGRENGSLRVWVDEWMLNEWMNGGVLDFWMDAFETFFY
jgi:hypothetical protein